MRPYSHASLPAGRDANQRRQVRRTAGLPSWRDANPRRQVPAGRDASLSARRDAKPRGQVPAGRAAGLSARRDANPRGRVLAGPAGCVSAGLRAQHPRRVCADAAIRMSAGPVPQSLRHLRSLPRVSGTFPAGGTRRVCPAPRHVGPGARRRDVAPMTFINGGRSMKLAIVFGAIIAGSAALAPQAVRAQDQRAETEAIVRDYLANHPDEVGEIVKGYFVKHPEAVGQILAELIKRHQNASPGAGARSAPDRSAAIAANAAELFSSPRQVTLGDPRGDVTLVEFFDYNCGFCKRALSDTLALVKDDPHLKIVLKEFPILGPGSSEAARVAIAVRMQDPGKYLAFHQELL